MPFWEIVGIHDTSLKQTKQHTYDLVEAIPVMSNKKANNNKKPQWIIISKIK